MTTLLRHLVGALCVLVVASCDPGFQLRGRIADSTDRPIADAKLSLVCGASPQLAAVSNAEGRFATSVIGWRPNTCFIEVDAPAHPALHLSVKNHCTTPHGDDACLGVWLDLIVP